MSEFSGVERGGKLFRLVFIFLLKGRMIGCGSKGAPRYGKGCRCVFVISSYQVIVNTLL